MSIASICNTPNSIPGPTTQHSSKLGTGTSSFDNLQQVISCKSYSLASAGHSSFVSRAYREFIMTVDLVGIWAIALVLLFGTFLSAMVWLFCRKIWLIRDVLSSNGILRRTHTLTWRRNRRILREESNSGEMILQGF